MEEGEDVLADEVAEFVDVALCAMLLRTAYVAGATGVIEGLAEVAEELDEAALLVVLDIGEHGVDTCFLTRLAVFVDGVGDADLVGVESWGEIDDGRVLTRGNIVEDVEAREEEELLIESVTIHACARHEVFLADEDIVGKHACIKTKNGLNDLLRILVELVEMIECLATRGEHETRMAVGLFVVDNVACLIEQTKGIVGGRNGELVGSAEAQEVELEERVAASADRDLEETRELLIDGADEVALGIFVGQVLDKVETVALFAKYPCCGWTEVATCSSCFLEILFGRRWKVEMDDKAHVGLVDAHAKGIGSNDDRYFARNPVILPFLLI